MPCNARSRGLIKNALNHHTNHTVGATRHSTSRYISYHRLKIKPPLCVGLSHSFQTRCPACQNHCLPQGSCVNLAMYLNLTSIKSIWQIEPLKIAQIFFIVDCYFICLLFLLLLRNLVQFVQKNFIHSMTDTAGIYSENYEGPSPREGGEIWVFKHSLHFQTQRKG